MGGRGGDEAVPTTNFINDSSDSIEYDIVTTKVIKATELIFNITNVKNFNFTGSSENFKLLSSINNVSNIQDNFTVDQNASNPDPQIPDYIRTTSMVFCVIIMCLGVIGNIMVNINFSDS